MKMTVKTVRGETVTGEVITDDGVLGGAKIIEQMRKAGIKYAVQYVAGGAIKTAAIHADDINAVADACKAETDKAMAELDADSKRYAAHDKRTDERHAMERRMAY
jgi:hypothetical protein